MRLAASHARLTRAEEFYAVLLCVQLFGCGVVRYAVLVTRIVSEHVLHSVRPLIVIWRSLDKIRPEPKNTKTCCLAKAANVRTTIAGVRTRPERSSESVSRPNFEKPEMKSKFLVAKKKRGGTL